MDASKFSDGSSSAFVELPVPAAFLSWTRGNAQLKSIAKDDPGLYFGGWRAFLKTQKDEKLPSLPIPVVTRSSQDGKAEYQVYATNVINFLPIAHRTRFEMRQKTVDPNTGRKFDKVIMVSKERQPGMKPYRQVFGWVFNRETDEYAPGVLKVFNWSAFISFEKAGQAWTKIQKTLAPDEILIRRYGSIGILKDKTRLPHFETYGTGENKSVSTPIEAVGIDKPRVFKITPELDALYEKAQEWANCPKWNAEGHVAEEVAPSADQQEFEARCNEIGLSNIEMADLLKESGGNYKTALAGLVGDAINEGVVTEEQINQALAESDLTDENPY